MLRRKIGCFLLLSGSTIRYADSSFQSFCRFQSSPAKEKSLLPENQLSSNSTTECPSFWDHDVSTSRFSSIKNEHKACQISERRSRFTARAKVKEHGVISNFYQLYYPIDKGEGLQSAPLYIYELEAFRVSKNNSSRKKRKKYDDADELENEPGFAAVTPSSIWGAVQQYFRDALTGLPPLVRCESRLYTTKPLEEKALSIPRCYYDLGWDSCKVTFIQKTTFASLCPSELQQITNQIVLWSVRYSTKGKHSVVKGTTGKIVSSAQGVVVENLRLYLGVIVQALFIKTCKATLLSNSDSHKACPVELLKEKYRSKTPLRFTVKSMSGSLEFKGKQFEKYRIEVEGKELYAGIWEPLKPKSLVNGATYEVKKFKLKKPDADKSQEWEVEFQKKCSFTLISEAKPEKTTPAVQESHESSLVLKIDAKGTMASTISILAEVWKKYGEGPYEPQVMERIMRELRNTPVLVSSCMKQSTIQGCCFDMSPGSEQGKLARELLSSEARKIMRRSDFVSNQPFALLEDNTFWPLQSLHCCFDPSARRWQDLGVAFFSLFPQKRIEVFKTYQKTLESGLAQWGLTLSANPLCTSRVVQLKSPEKTFDQRQMANRSLRHPFPPPQPSTVMVLGILGGDPALNDRVKQTVSRLGQYFRTKYVACLENEQAAVNYIVDQPSMGQVHLSEKVNRDKNSVAIFVTLENKGQMSRNVRWACAESLMLGVLPLVLKAPKSTNNQNLVCGNVRHRLRSSFQSDPLCGIKIDHEVPELKGKYTLMVGVDTCHTKTSSATSVVGILCTPERNHLIPFFYMQAVRGSEIGALCGAFEHILGKVLGLYPQLDEVVVFQDGSASQAMDSIEAEVVKFFPNCGFTFLCLSKGTNVRFLCKGNDSDSLLSASMGTVVEDLSPISIASELQPLSFHMQAHDATMSTPRSVDFKVHRISPAFTLKMIQSLSFAIAHVLSPRVTKLPMPARAAHRLADKAERIFDVAPNFDCNMIPEPLCNRLWFF